MRGNYVVLRERNYVFEKLLKIKPKKSWYVSEWKKKDNTCYIFFNLQRSRIICFIQRALDNLFYPLRVVWLVSSENKPKRNIKQLSYNDLLDKQFLSHCFPRQKINWYYPTPATPSWDNPRIFLRVVA